MKFEVNDKVKVTKPLHIKRNLEHKDKIYTIRKIALYLTYHAYLVEETYMGFLETELELVKE